jgi:transposase
MHTVIGVDLNRDRILTATVIHYNPETDTYTHSSHVYTFDGLGLFAKSLRLGQEQDELSAKIRRLSSLAKNNTDLHQCQQLEVKIAVLKLERERVNDKRGRISVELSHDAASWIQTIVDVHSATGVFFENLSSLPISFDTHTNTVLSQLPRGKILAYVEHKMTRLGVGVKTVRPAGTSSSCPYCLGKLTHPHAYASAVCTTCATSTHRDDLSPVRIAQKGHATHVRKRRPAEKRKRLDHKVERLAKTGPTPKQVKNQYRKRRARVKSSTYQKPVPFRKPRVVADMCVPSPEHMAHKVGVLTHTALVPPF